MGYWERDTHIPTYTHTHTRTHAHTRREIEREKKRERETAKMGEGCGKQKKRPVHGKREHPAFWIEVSPGLVS